MGGRLLAVAAGAAAVLVLLLALGRGGGGVGAPADRAGAGTAAAPEAAPLPEPSGELLSPPAPAAERVANAAGETSVVPLERLLSVPDTADADPDLLLDRNPHLRVGDAILPGEAGARQLSRRLRLEQRSEEMGSAGRKGAVDETDASVGVPVGRSDAVELRAGVRVRERSGTGEEDAETESTPGVGVDVRF